MTTDKCPMTDAAEQSATLRVDVCPECGGSQQYSGVLNFPCRYEWHYREWHDQAVPSEQKSLLREASKPPGKTGVEFVDRLADQWAARQSAALRGDMTGIKNANMWLGIIAKEYWGEIIASLRKTHAPKPAEPASATPRTLEVVHLLKALSKPETNYYLYDDGYCKSQKLADEAAKGLAQVEQMLRELAEARRERESINDQLLQIKQSMRYFKELSESQSGQLQEAHLSADDANLSRIEAEEERELLRGRAESAKARAAELQKAMEALRDDMLNKVMAATDDQIEAAIRMEGRDPKDVAAITRQALTNALHTVEMDKLKKQLDAETARADQNWNCAITYVSAYGLIINKQELGLNEKQRELITSLKVPQ